MVFTMNFICAETSFNRFWTVEGALLFISTVLHPPTQVGQEVSLPLPIFVLKAGSNKNSTLGSRTDRPACHRKWWEEEPHWAHEPRSCRWRSVPIQLRTSEEGGVRNSGERKPSKNHLKEVFNPPHCNCWSCLPIFHMDNCEALSTDNFQTHNWRHLFH